MFQDAIVALRILHTNDFHGLLDSSIQARLEPLRADADAYFDSGDCVKSGNLAVPMHEEPVWARLAALACSASVPGNRESHPLAPAFKKKIAGHAHPLVCANLEDRQGHLVLPPSVVIEAAGLKVGVIGGMVAMVTAGMATQGLSQYLWKPPIAAVVTAALELRPVVDVLIALTHIGFAQDRLLAAACPHLDIILGGHSHTVLSAPERSSGVWICQGGSHARFAGVYEFDAVSRQLSGGLVPLKA